MRRNSFKPRFPTLSLTDADSKRHLVLWGIEASATKTLATNERRQFSNLEIIWPVELRELGGATLTLQRVLARGSGDFTGLGAGRTGIAAVCTGANRREKGLRGQLVWTGVANDDRRLVSFEDSSPAEGCRT